MKSILVPLFGIDSDAAALHMARLAALPFSGHLDCLHVGRGMREMALATSNVGAGGLVTQDLWDALEEENRSEARHARKSFETFRKKFDIPVCDEPSGQACVTAAFHEILGEQFERIGFVGRTCELVILARGGSVLAPRPGQIGDLLMQCGAPILLAPQPEQSTLGKTVAIAWKDSAESARAVLAAMSFIQKAEKVVILSAMESAKDETLPQGVEALANELKWHGIDPETKIIPHDRYGVTESLLQAAEESHADLLVMGAYGHSRLQEFVLGGATRDILDSCGLPVFLFH